MKALKLKKREIIFVDFELFIECCELRYIYERGATKDQWRDLAAKFQQAKGPKVSHMAEYCMMKAGLKPCP